MYDRDLFDDPGDLGFFDKEEPIHEAPELDNDFDEPIPGEEE